MYGHNVCSLKKNKKIFHSLSRNEIFFVKEHFVDTKFDNSRLASFPPQSPDIQKQLLQPCINKSLKGKSCYKQKQKTGH